MKKITIKIKILNIKHFKQQMSIVLNQVKF